MSTIGPGRSPLPGVVNTTPGRRFQAKLVLVGRVFTDTAQDIKTHDELFRFVGAGAGVF